MTSTRPDPSPPTRRQRGRASAVREIKAAALDELRRHGAGGVTMRGVARAIDMTPSGLYRYFEDHGALLAALSVDAHDSLAQALDTVRTASPGECATQWFEGCHILRTWALEHVAEYGLVVGPPVAGVEPRHPEIVRAAGRLLRLPADTVAQAIVSGELVPAPVPLTTQRIASAQPGHAAGVPVQARVVAVGAVSALVGVVSLEAFGHFHGPASHRSEFFSTYVVEVMRGMGFVTLPERRHAGEPPSP